MKFAIRLPNEFRTLHWRASDLGNLIANQLSAYKSVFICYHLLQQYSYDTLVQVHLVLFLLFCWWCTVCGDLLTVRCLDKTGLYAQNCLDKTLRIAWTRQDCTPRELPGQDTTVHPWLRMRMCPVPVQWSQSWCVPVLILLELSQSWCGPTVPSSLVPRFPGHHMLVTHPVTRLARCCLTSVVVLLHQNIYFTSMEWL